MSEQHIPTEFLGVLVEEEITTISLEKAVHDVDQLVADIMSDPEDTSMDTIDGLAPDVWARRKGIIQPYANPRAPKSVRAVVNYYDEKFDQFGNTLYGLIEPTLNYEGGDAWSADGTYLGVLEPNPEHVVEWNREVERVRVEEARLRKQQEKYVNKLPAWELEKWRIRNRIVFQPLSEDYDPSVATYNSTFIEELMNAQEDDEA